MAKNISQVFAANPITSVAGTSLIYIGVGGVDGAIQGMNLYNSASNNATFNNATLVATTNQLILGTTKTTTISATAPASSAVYTIPDAGTAANFVMSAGTQTVGGALTLSGTVIYTNANPIKMNGGGSTFVTLNINGPVTDRVYTFPDAGANANILLSQGAQTIAGVNTFTSQLNVNANIDQSITANSTNLNFNTENFATVGPTLISHSLYANNSTSGTQCFIIVGHHTAQQYTFGWDRSTNNFLISAGGTLNSSNALIINQSSLCTFPNALTISPATNQLVLGTTTTTTISATAPASSAVYTIPDAGTAANFLMSAGTQTIAGANTFSSALTINPVSNQLVLGGVSAGNTTTISATAPASNATYTIPDAGTSANFLMSRYATSTIATTGATNPTAANSGTIIGVPVLTGSATATLPAVASSTGLRFRYVCTNGVTALGHTFVISTTDSKVLSGNFMVSATNTQALFGTTNTLTFSASSAGSGDWLEFYCLNGKWNVNGGGFSSASIVAA